AAVRPARETAPLRSDSSAVPEGRSEDRKPAGPARPTSFPTVGPALLPDTIPPPAAQPAPPPRVPPAPEGSPRPPALEKGDRFYQEVVVGRWSAFRTLGTDFRHQSQYAFLSRFEVEEATEDGPRLVRQKVEGVRLD